MREETSQHMKESQTREQIEETSMDLGLAEGKVRRGFSPLPSLRTFRSFKNPVFRLYYMASLGHMGSFNMQLVTRNLLVYRISGSAAILGVVALASALPLIMFSLLGGVIADRIQKKYVLLTGQSISATISLGVALTLSVGYLSAGRAGSWWVLVVASVLQSSVVALMMPSRQAIIAEIVGEEQLMNAVALNSFGMNIFRLLAPALAGVLIDGLGFEAIYFTMTGLYLIAVFFISLMPQTSTMDIAGRGALRDMIDGLKYVRHHTRIVLILLFTLFAGFVTMPYMFLMPIFADDILKVGATGMGVLFSVSGVGALIGSIVLASLPNRKRGAMLLFCGILLGMTVFGFAFSYSWYLSLALMAIVGLGQTGRMALGNTLLQYYVDDEYRGRVMSIHMMDFGFTSLGVFVVALLVEGLGVQWSLGGTAVILVFLSLLMLMFAPQIRNLD